MSRYRFVRQIESYLQWRRMRAEFQGSDAYWKQRYSTGGNSGAGSYGKFATFKAEVLNEFVARNEIRSVLEFGCGDGAQLSLASYPGYIGLDISAEAIRLCRAKFEGDRSKSFFLYSPEAFVDNAGIFRADLTLSLDVIYHLTEDATFEAYMRHLFGAARSLVVIYSSDLERSADVGHVRNRKFTPWVGTNFPDWRLIEKIPNKYPFTGDHTEGSWSDFFIYGRADG